MQNLVSIDLMVDCFFQTLFPIALLFWVKQEINAGIAIPIHSFLLWCSIRVSGTENRGDK